METVLILTVLAGLTVWLLVRSRGKAPQSRQVSRTEARPKGTVLPPLDGGSDPQLEDFLSRQYRKRRYYFRAKLSSGQVIGVGHTPHEDWVDVAARRQIGGEKSGPHPGPYEAFGYHVRQGRWSFGSRPPEAHEISRILSSYLGAREQQPRGF